MGQEEISASGTSYLNRGEAGNVEKIVTTFLKSGVVPAQVCLTSCFQSSSTYISFQYQESLFQCFFEELLLECGFLAFLGTSRWIKYSR